MGTSYKDGIIRLPGTKAHKKVIKHIRSLIDESVSYYGSNPYSGQLSTKHDNDIVFLDRSFRSHEKARDHIATNSSKYGPVLVARVTNRGNPFWYFGASCRE